MELAFLLRGLLYPKSGGCLVRCRIKSQQLSKGSGGLFGIAENSPQVRQETNANYGSGAWAAAVPSAPPFLE